MTTLRTLALACGGLLLASGAALAADTEGKHGFLNLVYKDADGKEAKYILFVPHDYKGDKAYPLILFLHGDADTAVPVKRSRDMIAALKVAGGQPKYDEFPGVGHNSWDKAYGNQELYDWLLQHHLK